MGAGGGGGFRAPKFITGGRGEGLGSNPNQSIFFFFQILYISTNAVVTCIVGVQDQLLGNP